MVKHYIYSLFCKSILCKVEFQAIDRSYMTSPPIVVHISIRATETNAPRVSWNMGTKVLLTKKPLHCFIHNTSFITVKLSTYCLPKL